MNTKLTLVICRDRTDHSLQQRLETGLLEALADNPRLEVAVLAHLYDLAPDGAGMEYLRSLEGDLIVLSWLYPRAAYWILDANQVRGRMGATSFFSQEELPPAPAAEDAAADRTIWCIDLRGQQDPGRLLREIDRIANESLGAAVAVSAPAPATPTPRHLVHAGESAHKARWYPVVDRQKCVNCMECLNFCLFGVFGLDESGVLWVEQADACRDGCPACSRICPAGAIMFPEHSSRSIAGDQPAGGARQLDVVPTLGDRAARAVADLERQRAVTLQQANAANAILPTPKSPTNDALDALVDELDRSDL
jgi:Pyruvate/2-oxoacid:ferredoxin oxidoreductase delta subunit